MMTRVYSASDSISTKPRINAKRMAAVAPGLRAMASAAPATAFACPRPQRPLAMAMEKPEEMATQLVAGAGVPPWVWAKIGMAKHRIASARKNVLRVILVSLLE